MMKKTMMMVVAGLLIAVAASAQGVKISPKMEKGMKKVYKSETVMNVAGKELNLKGTQTFVVADRQADGWQLNFTASDFESNVGDDPMGLVMLLGQLMNDGVTSKMKTDANGKVTGLINIDEIKQRGLDAAEVIFNRLLEKSPEMAQMLPKDALREQLGSQLTEENMVKTMQEAASVMALNGRQIATGAQEDFVNMQGMKMKRMYFLTKKDGSAITTNAKIDMSKDELKQLIFSQAEKTMPDQLEMIKQNIDMMMSQMNFDATEKATYEFGADGWVRSMTVESQMDAMGQKTSQTTTITLVE